jgi:hypothetical protein
MIKKISYSLLKVIIFLICRPIALFLFIAGFRFFIFSMSFLLQTRQTIIIKNLNPLIFPCVNVIYISIVITYIHMSHECQSDYYDLTYLYK